MRQRFQHFFRPSEAELRRLWESGVFVFDASVLLNVYGYSPETCEDLLSLLERLAPRVHLPHQFALEFARDRSTVVLKQVSNYNDAERALRKIKDQFLAPKREHPFLTSNASEAFDSICAELANGREKMASFIGQDPHLDRILKVFENRIGAEPSEDELNAIHARAKERFEHGVPPGYEDLKEKDPPNAYGDYIGWVQLIEIAKAQAKGVVLVIDDFKGDWWLIEKERTIGPRPELVDEFQRETNLQFFMYTSENFLQAATLFANFSVDARSIDEVRERLAQQRDEQRLNAIKSTDAEAAWESIVAKASGAVDEAKGVEAKPPATGDDDLMKKTLDATPKASDTSEE